MNIHNLSIDNQLVMKSTDYCLPDKKVSSNTDFFYTLIFLAITLLIVVQSKLFISLLQILWHLGTRKIQF